MATEYERLIEQDGEVLAQNLAYHCIAAVKEVIDTLAPGGGVPPDVDLTGASLVVLSVRAAVDLQAIGATYDDRAAELMLEALDRHFSTGGLVTTSGGFRTWVAAARKTMIDHPDPREWIPAQCVALLGTRDPEDELFHLALAKGLTAGTSLPFAIEQAASKRN
jgi:hypothetical protein